MLALGFPLMCLVSVGSRLVSIGCRSHCHSSIASDGGWMSAATPCGGPFPTFEEVRARLYAARAATISAARSALDIRPVVP
jgi:hypothetical protein